MNTRNRILLSTALLIGATQAYAQSEAHYNTPPLPPDSSSVTPGRDGTSGVESRNADPSSTTPGTSAGGETLRDGVPPPTTTGRLPHGTGSAAAVRSGSQAPTPADNNVRSGAVLPSRALPNGGTTPNEGAVTPDSSARPRGTSAPPATR